ncbi:MAG: glycosyltransferase family 2 protein [Thermodesulforhabdaceae bacterium]
MKVSGELQVSDSMNWLKRLYRRQGILNRALALKVIPFLLELLQMCKDSREAKEILSLALSIAKQTLAFNPFDYELFKLILRIDSLYSTSSFQIPWLVKLQSYYRFFDKSLLTSDEKSIDWVYDNKFKLEELNPLLVLKKVMILWEHGDWQTISSVEKKLFSVSYRSLLSPYIAWICFRAGDYEAAERWLSYEKADSFLTFNLKAELSLQRGDLEKAIGYWIRSLEEDPYQLWILYRLYELDQPEPSRNILSNKKIHILLYTYNKLDSLVSTFKSLINSCINDARIIILNNGSTSFSPKQLEETIRNVASGRIVSFVHLPVNIGVPAARNWLWHLPEVQESDYVAFLDDHVLVPEDWLINFVHDLESFPDTVVVGPMVVNPDPLFTPQWAYLYLSQVDGDKIKFTPIVPLPFDVGQYSVRRPCLCIMGCCHLFHRERWKRLNLPDFDIRFSPSQVDDIEHSIQTWKCGGEVLFDGRVKVTHLQVSGRKFIKSKADEGQLVGNHIKMEAKFSDQDLVMIDDRVAKADDRFWKTVLDRAIEFIPNNVFKMLPGHFNGEKI